MQSQPPVATATSTATALGDVQEAFSGGGGTGWRKQSLAREGRQREENERVRERKREKQTERASERASEKEGKREREKLAAGWEEKGLRGGGEEASAAAWPSIFRVTIGGPARG